MNTVDWVRAIKSLCHSQFDGSSPSFARCTRTKCSGRDGVYFQLILKLAADSLFSLSEMFPLDMKVVLGSQIGL